MRKSMRKCREMEELTVIGVRTRAMTSALASPRKRRKEASSTMTAEYQIAYLELRNRKLIMRTRISRSSGSSSRSLTVDHGSPSSEVVADSQSAVCYFQSRTERSRSDGSYELESTVERRAPPQISTATMTPSEAEIEEFFAAAELKESQRFAKTYNFDVVNDVPLEGRYEWVAVAP